MPCVCGDVDDDAIAEMLDSVDESRTEATIDEFHDAANLLCQVLRIRSVPQRALGTMFSSLKHREVNPPVPARDIGPAVTYDDVPTHDDDSSDSVCSHWADNW